MQKVLIKPTSYKECLTAVQRAFELFPMPMRGKKVFIKPNVLRSAWPEECITTHPAILRAVVDCVEAEAPAEIIVGDNPGMSSYGINEKSFCQTGLMDAAKGYYQNIGIDSIILPFNPDYKEKVSVSRAVLEADVMISLPKFKTHGLTVLTGAIKNNYGILPGGQKAVLHRRAGSPRRFHEMVVDVFKLRVPDLFIMDAVLAMQGNGPVSTEIRYVGQILASKNAVALDAVMARMAGVEPTNLRFLQKAVEERLGAIETSAIELEGKLTAIPDFKLPPLSGEAHIDSPRMIKVIENRVGLRPHADENLCTACETCVEQCPVSALSMQENLPEVDPDKCIICFCCQEICPEKAIALK
jgi:uncharacterized protein (DUF362 family)/NAD-dependent dihydropyrimidine dehydrogenase PreA subunit